MALTFDVPSKKAIGLAECIDQLRAIEDVHNPHNLDQMADLLKRLSNNKKFLAEFIDSEIKQTKDIAHFQRTNPFPQQVISLGGAPGFWLRANFWPPTDKQHPKDWERSLFAYLKAHDHDSGFLTVGYWGEGYETIIHEYDPQKVVGYRGEKIALSVLETTRLDDGKVMYYRANRDIHTQIAPEARAVSINLLIQKPGRDAAARQFWFNTDRSEIDSPILRPEVASAICSCKLARAVGGIRAIEALEAALKSHYSPYVREAAYEALCELDSCKAEYYAAIARVDHHPLVRRLADASG